MARKEDIERILKNERFGLTIQDISDRLKINRITTRVLLAELMGSEKIGIKEVGRAKLHYLKG